AGTDCRVPSYIGERQEPTPRMRLHGQHRHWYVRHLPPRVPVLLCYAQSENCCAQYASPRSELTAALRADFAGGCGERTSGKVLQRGAATALLMRTINHLAQTKPLIFQHLSEANLL